MVVLLFRGCIGIEIECLPAMAKIPCLYPFTMIQRTNAHLLVTFDIMSTNHSGISSLVLYNQLNCLIHFLKNVSCKFVHSALIRQDKHHHQHDRHAHRTFKLV